MCKHHNIINYKKLYNESIFSFRCVNTIIIDQHIEKTAKIFHYICNNITPVNITKKKLMIKIVDVLLK